MRAAAIALTTSLVLASGSFGPANADSEKAPLVPGYEAARDLPAELAGAAGHDGDLAFE